MMALLTPLIPYNMILLLHHVMSSDNNTLSYLLNMEGNVNNIWYQLPTIYFYTQK